MAQDVDITGTMAKAIPNWQERVEKLAKPEFWDIQITPKIELWGFLGWEEKKRLEVKMDMVAEATRWLMAGMTKGTVKYASDDWTLKRWMAHMMGEGADQFCYQMLLFNRWRQDEQERKEALAKIKAAWNKKEGE